MTKFRGRIRLPFGITAMMVLGLLAFLGTGPGRAADELAPPKPDKATKEFYHDFRDKNFPNINFRTIAGSLSRPAGLDAAPRIKSEPEGLHITLPAGQKEMVGVATQFHIQGDFEITVGYEIGSLQQPERNVGAGFELYVMTNGPTQEGLAFSRKIRPDGSNVYVFSLRMKSPKGKRQAVPGQNLDDIPADANSGHLRITRIGPKAVLSAAEGPSKEFRVLHTVDLGAADVSLLRLAAHPGDGPDEMDLRLFDLRARAEGFSEVVDTRPPPPGTALWMVAVLLAALLIIGSLLLWWRMRRKPLTAAETKRDVSDQPPAEPT